MQYSFTWNSRCLSCTLSVQTAVSVTQGFGFLHWKASIMPDFAPCLDTTHRYLSAREERREGKGSGKLQCTIGGDAQDLRMMGRNSHCESRRDRSQSDMRKCSDHRPVCTGRSIVHVCPDDAHTC